MNMIVYSTHSNFVFAFHSVNSATINPNAPSCILWDDEVTEWRKRSGVSTHLILEAMDCTVHHSTHSQMNCYHADSTGISFVQVGQWIHSLQLLCKLLLFLVGLSIASAIAAHQLLFQIQSWTAHSSCRQIKIIIVADAVMRRLAYPRGGALTSFVVACWDTDFDVKCTYRFSTVVLQGKKILRNIKLEKFKW